MLDNVMGTRVAVNWGPRPIMDLRIAGHGLPPGQHLVYRPKEDITPLELAHLLHMFLALTVPTMMGGYDVPEFLARHGLQRHFDAGQPADSAGGNP
jgi:hypothetical protein